jgi:putative endonuclease
VALSNFWFLYVLCCADGTIYVGVTTDLKRRTSEHNIGRGARYTAGRRPVRLVAAWRFPDRGAAQRAEIRLRRLPQARKLALVAQRLPFAGVAFWCDECATDTWQPPACFCPCQGGDQEDI